jgi:hypothetical protein
MGQREEFVGALGRCYVLVGTIDSPAARKRVAAPALAITDQLNSISFINAPASDPLQIYQNVLPLRRCQAPSLVFLVMSPIR